MSSPIGVLVVIGGGVSSGMTVTTSQLGRHDMDDEQAQPETLVVDYHSDDLEFTVTVVQTHVPPRRAALFRRGAGRQ